MTKTTYIYTLIDPRDQTHHYIGKTVQNPPQKRLQQHLKKPATDDLAQWVDDLQQAGLKPSLQLLESVPVDADWRAAEVYWIRYGLAHKWQLKNKASGGDNYPLELLQQAKPQDIISRMIYADEETLRLLTSINAYVMRGKTAEDNTFRDLIHESLLLVQAEHTNTFDTIQKNLSQRILSQGIIQITRGWRVPIIKKYNRVGGEFFAVGKPFAINGIGIPGKWDKNGWRISIKFYKETSDLLDILATEKHNEQRRGYNDVLNRAADLLATIFDQVVNM